MPEVSLKSFLGALHHGEIDFILVGGMAAVLGGSPTTTLDIGVVHSREPANIARLLSVLESLDAIFRIRLSAA